MKTFRVGGIRIPIAPEGRTLRTQRWGKPGGKAVSGRPSGRRRAIVEEFSGRTPIVEQDKADAIEAILGGRGHLWRFSEDLISSAGLAPDAGPGVSGAEIVQTNETVPTWRQSGVSHERALIIEDPVIYPTAIADEWTLATWWNDGDVEVQPFWYCMRSDFAAWDNISGIVVRDDTKFNEYTGNTAFIDEVTGALVIGPKGFGCYADLFLIPSKLTDEQIDDLALYVTRPNPSLALHVADQTLVHDVVSGEPGLPSGDAVVGAEGPTGPAISVRGAGYVDVKNASNSGAAITTTVPRVTVEAHVLVRPMATGEYIIARTAADDEIKGWAMFARSVSGLNWRLNFAVARATTRASCEAAPSLEFGRWYHVVFAFDSVSGFSVYVDGEEVAKAEENVGAGAIVPDDANSPLRIGGDTYRGNPASLDGMVQGLRCYRVKMPAPYVAALYDEQMRGESPEDVRTPPPSPDIVARGTMTGGRTRQYLASVESQDMVSFAGDDGEWIKANRTVPFNLTEKPAPFPYLPLQPYAVFSLDESLTGRAATRRAVVGDHTSTRSEALTYTRYPYSPWRALRIAGQVPHEVISQSVSSALHIAWGVCVFSVVRMDVISASEILTLQSSVSTTNKLALAVLANNRVNIRARSQNADTQRIYNVAGVEVPSAGQWCLVGGWVDLRGGPSTQAGLGVFCAYDDPLGGVTVTYSAGPKTVQFGRATFSDQTGDNNRIGQSLSGLLRFDGDIALLGFARDVVPTPRDVRALWRAIKAGRPV
jgi:hypothetical protein